MPEGPEVKKVSDYLAQKIKNDIIVGVEINSGRYKKHGPFSGYHELIKLLPAKVTYVACKGKFIWVQINHAGYLCSTLGMTGKWTQNNNKHSHVALVMSNGEKMYFNDMRNFGTLRYYSDHDNFRDKLNSIGPDMLSGYIRASEFYSLIQKHNKKTISEFLMNQKIISGIGNYLKAECLYAAKISPHRLCKHIEKEESENLFNTCRSIIRRSYESGGATISTYRQPTGEKGLYSRRFAVYNQSLDPFGNRVIKETTKDKRTTHWVPDIQK